CCTSTSACCVAMPTRSNRCAATAEPERLGGFRPAPWVRCTFAPVPARHQRARREVTTVRLLLIRHAQSAGNAEGIIQGHADFPLSERGRMQAMLLAQRLGHAPAIDALYSSPLSRAYDTARAIAARTGHAIRAMD